MSNQEDYVQALKILFSKSVKDLIAIASNNDDTITTLELCYLCYIKNLLPLSFMENFDYDVLLQYVNGDLTKNPDSEIEDLNDIHITDECKYFIDKFSFFATLRNVVKAKKQKSEYYSNYIAYLFLFDGNLRIHEIIYDCVPSSVYSSVLNAVQVKLLSVANLPSDEPFQNYGKYLTNPFDLRLTPCYNRDNEISAIIDILSRKTKNNPLLVGQPGVGKTAVVHGLAELMMTNKCPKHLQEYHIFELNYTSLVSGAMYRGDLEKRLSNVFDTIINKNRKVILFIDEIHILMNGKSGDNEAAATSGSPPADILKPYLNNPKVKIIGATTEQEFKMLEKDGAILRRFNKVSIKEPDKDTVLQLLHSLCEDYEKYFDIQCPEYILRDIVNYADLYIPNRYMPDKVIDLFDQTFVHCKNHSDRDELTDYDVIKSVESMTNISVPVPNNTVTDKIQNIISKINDVLVGQDKAVNIVESMLKRYFMGLCNTSKPIASYLFVGPTGVGKTALCKELATNLFNAESFVKLDMSEYMEKHAVAKLIGAPPGYVGHGKGGKLTETVKHNPYSLILFDEIEKAHQDVYNILLQILDEGVLTDSEGYKVNFKNCIIVLTSNIGATNVRDKASNTVGFGDNTLSNKDICKIYESAIKKHFSPEFLNRLDNIVYFNSLSKDNIKGIVDIELNKVIDKFKNINITVSIPPKVKEYLYEQCYKPEYGARFVQRELTKIVEDKVIDYLVNNRLVGETVSIRLSMSNDEIKITKMEKVVVN